MAEDRKVSVDLEVTKSGETGAFKDAAQEVRDLDAAAADSTGGLDQLAEKQSEAGEAASGMGQDIAAAGRQAATAKGQIEGAGDAAATAGDKAKLGGAGFVDFQTKLALAIPAVNVAGAAIDTLEDGLNTLSKALGGTGKEFDLFKNPIEATADGIRHLVERMGNLGEAFKALENAPGSVADKLIAAQKAFEGFDKPTEKFRASLQGINKDLNDEVAALEEAIRSLEATGSIHEAESERIKNALDAIAEKAKRAGADLPAAFDGLIAKYGEVAAASEERVAGAGEETAAVQQSGAAQTSSIGEVSAAQTELASTTQAASAAQEEATQAASAARVVWDEQTRTLRTLGETAEEAGAQVAAAGEKMGEGADDLAATGAAATDAGAGLGTVKAGVAGLGDAAASASTGLGALATDLGVISPAASPVATALQAIEAAAASVNSIKLTAFIGELKAAEAAAFALKAALLAVDEG